MAMAAKLALPTTHNVPSRNSEPATRTSKAIQANTRMTVTSNGIRNRRASPWAYSRCRRRIGAQNRGAPPRGVQQAPPPHRRRQNAFYQLAPPHVHDPPADPPHRARHQVHADEPGDEEVDVAGPALGHRLVACHPRVPPPR